MMMKSLGGLILTLSLLGLALLIVGQMGGLRASTPTDLGVMHGRLRPPSDTPNSVSSQAYLYPAHSQHLLAQIEPLHFEGDGDAAMKKLVAALQSLDRTVVVRHSTDYVYAQSSTRLLRFTDDLEFWLDSPARVIHVRSASRLGRSDFGVNRARIETLRARFTARS